jgi:hypothetical protein
VLKVALFPRIDTRTTSPEDPEENECVIVGPSLELSTKAQKRLILDFH